MSDDEFPEVNHNRLVESIKNFVDGKRENVNIKTVITKKGKKKDNATLVELVGAIKSTKNVSNLKDNLDLGDGKERKLKNMKSTKLSVPLHRQERTRVQSKVAYSDIRKQLRTWDPIVQLNRAAEQMKFPLGPPEPFYSESVMEKTKSFAAKSSLELRLANALGQSGNAVDNTQLYTQEEKVLLNALSLKDAKERTSKLQKMRAVMSFRAAKFARDSKIKSKKYHRLRKKEQRKKIIKEIEDLLATNPDAAKEKLQELEVDRAYERATLKHRSTNKWSVQLRQYASRNPHIEQLISEHLNIGREFKKKNGIDIYEENSEDEGVQEKTLTKTEVLKLAVDQVERSEKNSNPWNKKNFIEQKVSETVDVNLDVSEIISLADNDDVLHDEFLRNAFDGEDVVAEFKKQKEDDSEKANESPKDERLFGWGDWTGEGIDRNKELERKKRFVNAPKMQRRTDRGNSKLIIRESSNSEFRKLQPADVPFPFTAVKDFEATIRQPLGRDWNTSLSHKNLVKKAVVTKAGSIIHPISKSDLKPEMELPENELDEILGV